MEKLLFTVEEAADLIAVKKSRLYVMITRGELPAVKVGASVRLRADDLKRWAKAQPAREVKA